MYASMVDQATSTYPRPCTKTLWGGHQGLLSLYSEGLRLGAVHVLEILAVAQATAVSPRNATKQAAQPATESCTLNVLMSKWES